ncbi:carboxypeptidase regulatory-like domain-containing protein [Candidatus Saganbacteria bacterium]|nr:carboxypeptidase regulatory-like domain-containing protein [Candidatus Saganbacteria bacterium]
MTNRKLVFWILILGFTTLVVGCGKLSNSPNIVSLANQGEISGKIYSLSASNYYADKFVPIPGAKVTVGTIEVIASADGSYKISGVQAGEMQITATAEGFSANTIKANRNVINFYLQGGSSSTEKGTATITGTIYGLPSGISSVYGSAISAAKGSSSSSYDPSLYKYTITGAPDDGETYVFAYYSTYEAGLNRRVYSYKKVSMTSASREVDLDFAASDKSLVVNIKNKQGLVPGTLYAHLYNGYRLLLSGLYNKSQTQEGTVNISKIPALEPGDSYSVNIYASGTAAGDITSINLYKNSLTAGQSVDLDISTIPDFKINSPTSGETLSSHPTFAWEPISDDKTLYVVYLYPTDSYSTIWWGMTKSSSITLPEAVILNSGGYKWSVAVLNASNLDPADIIPSISQSSYNWIIGSSMRSFTYAK